MSNKSLYARAPDTWVPETTVTPIETDCTGILIDLFPGDMDFCFVRTDNQGPDIFCHCDALPKDEEDTLSEGSVVVFDRAFDKGRNRSYAINVRPTGQRRRVRKGFFIRDWRR